MSYTVTTICGSMRFYDRMLKAAEELSKSGHIVLMPFVTFKPEDQTSETKEMLDRMHFRKIDMSDSITVITDETGYIGESTRNEMDYAMDQNKHIYVHHTAHLGELPCCPCTYNECRCDCHD